MTMPDDEFEAYLRRREPLFPRAHEEPLEPPAELDRIVLGQAREAIKPRREPGFFRGQNWGAPFAIAATVLLAFGVVMNVEIPSAMDEPAMGGQEIDVRSASRITELPAELPAEAPAPPQIPMQDAPASRAAEPVAAAPTAAPARALQRRERNAELAPVAAPPPASAPAEPVLRASAESELARAEAQAGDSGPGSAEEKRAVAQFRYETSEEAVVTQDVRPRSAGTASVAATPAGSRAAPIPRPEIARSARLASDDAIQGSSAAKADVRASPAPAADQRATQPRWRRNVESWAAEIERLRAAGEDERANAELAEFQRQHPDYDVSALLLTQ